MELSNTNVEKKIVENQLFYSVYNFQNHIPLKDNVRTTIGYIEAKVHLLILLYMGPNADLRITLHNVDE